VVVLIGNKYEMGLIGSYDLDLVIKTTKKLMMTFMKFSHSDLKNIR
jgi:hypothetical protein